jgi:hypothetical protein
LHADSTAFLERCGQPWLPKPCRRSPQRYAAVTPRCTTAASHQRWGGTMPQAHRPCLTPAPMVYASARSHHHWVPSTLIIFQYIFISEAGIMYGTGRKSLLPHNTGGVSCQNFNGSNRECGVQCLARWG